VKTETALAFFALSDFPENALKAPPRDGRFYEPKNA
jgi:hypothetical protein